MKERNLHVSPVFNIKMSSHITVYATPGPQTTRHPVIPYSCAVRSDLGRCSIHHSPPFGHTIKVWAEGDVTNCCQTGARWNPLVKLMSLAYLHPSSTQNIYCQFFVSNQPPHHCVCHPCMRHSTASFSTNLKSITQHLITVFIVLTSETTANNQTPGDTGITLLTPCTAITFGYYWQINQRGVSRRSAARLIISHVL